MKIEQKVAVSVFAIAFTFGLNITGVVPVLGMISEQYQGYGTSMIQMMQTIPYALLMVGSLFLGVLVTKWSKKRVAEVGLLIVGICGVLPFFSYSFALLFVARLLIGFGFGLIAPINTAISAEYIVPEKRAGYMGLHVVGMGIGTLFGNLLGSFFARSGLRYFYLVYLVAFVACVVVQLILPNGKPVQAEKASDLKLNGMVYVLSGVAFLHTLFINAYNTNISMYITEKISTDPTASGIATAVSSVCALVMGVLFAKISGALKRATLPFSVFASAVGYAVVLFVPGMAGALISSALCGVSLSCFNAMGGYLMSIIVKEEAVAKASSMFSIVGGIGGLIAPVALGAMANGLGGNTPVHQFEIAMAGMAALGVVLSILIAMRFAEKEEA